MSAHALVLRPEPGASETAARLIALGVPMRCCPLFAVAPVGWQVPDARGYDALLLTSANAVRHAGPELRALAALPVVAVGEATSAAARDAGMTVVLTGERGVSGLVAAAAECGLVRLLHLAGRDRTSMASIDHVVVYASEAIDIASGVVRGWAGQIALLHSARAARRFADLVDRFGTDRTTIAIAALSDAIAEAVGSGWRSCTAAARPDDALLTMVAGRLIDPSVTAADKQA